MSGYGHNLNGFNYRQPNYQNPDHCLICNRAFYTIEALLNHYDAHTREFELASRAAREGRLPPINNPLQLPPFYAFNAQPAPSLQALNLQNNLLQLQFQEAQRNLGFPLQPLQVPAPVAPPQAPPVRNDYAVIQQQMQQRAAQLGRGQNLIRPNVIRPRAHFGQPNQPAASVPDIIDLDFDYEDDSSSSDGSINLDLTLD
ncbi:hypothetical protein ACOSP7_006714 [Xanthoceras sorbifolium]